jgi:hypothetical protein
LVGQKIVEDSPGLIELNRHLVDLENLTKESLERKRRFSLGRRAIS